MELFYGKHIIWIDNMRMSLVLIGKYNASSALYELLY